jgi:hypothetical protein
MPSLAAATRRRALPSLSILLLVAGCAESPLGPAGPFASVTHGGVPTVSVPFDGRADGQDVSVTFEANGLHIIANASGTASGVGKFTEVLDYVLAYDFVHFAGGATITATDGAQIRLGFAGAIPGFASQVFPLPYTATYTITGGTGRLAGSTGGGALDGTDFGAGAFALSFTGTRLVPRGAPDR